jgi:hypothetical protein
MTMRRWLVLAVVPAIVGSAGGCAFHHVEFPDPDRPADYVDWEPEPEWWGSHVDHEYSE